MERREPVYPRESYLRKLRPFYHDTDIIKVLTGVRRCGKSCIMQMVAEELETQGVANQSLALINLDRRKYRKVRTTDQLDELIESFVTEEGVTYLFIDEVQNVDGFEEVLNSWREEGTCSIFITGSNSYLLSGELATKLTGRYLEFEVFTLTFAEYEGMKRFYGKPIDADRSAEFDRYLLEGGFPRAVRYDSMADKRAYVRGVVEEIFEKDIRRRAQVREEKYYVSDLGFYFALNTDNRIAYGPALENVVYLYARDLGYSVSVGRIGRLECDFIVRDDEMDYAYVQVSYTIADRRTEDREYASLEKARDGYPKFLLTCDRLLQKRSGVIHENLVDFLEERRDFRVRG